MPTLWNYKVCVKKCPTGFVPITNLMILEESYHNGAKPIDGCIETKYTVFGCETATLNPNLENAYVCVECLPGMAPWDNS